MINKQIRVVFLVDNFVFQSLEEAQKFVQESEFESSEKEPNPSYKGRDIWVLLPQDLEMLRPLEKDHVLLPVGADH